MFSDDSIDKKEHDFLVNALLNERFSPDFQTKEAYQRRGQLLEKFYENQNRQRKKTTRRFFIGTGSILWCGTMIPGISAPIAYPRPFIPRSLDSRFSNKQVQILLGGILGDGTLEPYGKNDVISVRFKEKHMLSQRSLLDFYSANLGFLSQRVQGPKARIGFDRRTNHEYSFVEWSSSRDKALVPFFESFYRPGDPKFDERSFVKTIPPNFENIKLDGTALALLLCGDGGRRNTHDLQISLCNFTRAELARIGNTFQKKFDAEYQIRTEYRNVEGPNKTPKIAEYNVLYYGWPESGKLIMACDSEVVQLPGLSYKFPEHPALGGSGLAGGPRIRRKPSKN